MTVLCRATHCTRVVHRQGLCRTHYDDPTSGVQRRRHSNHRPRPGCILEACPNPHHAAGFCTLHYGRHRNNGDPLIVRAFKNAPPAVRFWAKVDKQGPVPLYAPHLGSCWIWTATLTEGYGRFIAQARRGERRVWVAAHRWSYEHLVGPIPAGLELDHLCRVRDCVNPGHLEPVTSAENLRRAREALAVPA